MPRNLRIPKDTNLFLYVYMRLSMILSDQVGFPIAAIEIKCPETLVTLRLSRKSSMWIIYSYMDL